MIVSCPHCSAVYELPMHLLGEGGAAVRCPHCAGEFAVDAEGKTHAAGGARAAEPAASAAIARGDVRAAERDAAPGSGAARAAAVESRAGGPLAKVAAPRPAVARDAPESRAGADPGADLHAIARRVLDQLDARKGKALSDAGARGRLFAEFGPDLIAAFEEYRREGGGTENAAPFRDALRERWGIDLTPPARGA